MADQPYIRGVLPAPRPRPSPVLPLGTRGGTAGTQEGTPGTAPAAPPPCRTEGKCLVAGWLAWTMDNGGPSEGGAQDGPGGLPTPTNHDLPPAQGINQGRDGGAWAEAHLPTSDQTSGLSTRCSGCQAMKELACLAYRLQEGESTKSSPHHLPPTLEVPHC